MKPDAVLAGLPTALRETLLKCFAEIATNYFERRWEPAELNGGKFCEAVYHVLNHAIRGSPASKPTKIRNIKDSCLALENQPATSRPGDHSLRILIPRMLLPLYDIRNNRGVGHLGGDVDPNFLDATAVVSMSSWVMAELVRVFHGTTTDEAQKAVDGLIEFKHPLVWEIGSMRRVLDTTLNAKDQTLVLLYGLSTGASSDQLFKWIEYTSARDYRSKVLRPLHDGRKLEFNPKTDLARISPLGVKEVEARLLDKLDHS